MTILLGFELDTGKGVVIPLRHLAVTGQTQLSGKTTTLEALVARSGVRAVAFVTKRSEGSFRAATSLPAFFRERADWQFVASILEATMRERQKFERPWIIRACHGARTLAEVHANIRRELPKARGLNQSVLTSLSAYLEIVLPQIARLPYTRRLDLQPGLNVMDLSRFSMEMQGLVIRSVLEEVYEKYRRTITIIPEAWEFLPQSRGSPVLLSCEELIRKGAAAENFVWLDSQDIAAVHKNVLRQVGVWILGVQREANEVKRALAHIPLGSPKPTPRDVMTLTLGTFYVCFADVMKKVYVQPAWVSEIEARSYALGRIAFTDLPKPAKRAALVDFALRGANAQEAVNEAIEIAERTRTAAPANPLEILAAGEAVSQSDESAQSADEEDIVWKEKYDDAEKTIRDLSKQIQEHEEEILRLQAEISRSVKGKSQKTSASDSPTPDTSAPDGGYAGLRARLLDDLRARLLADPKVLAVLAERPEIEIRVSKPVLEVDGKSLRGRLGRLIHSGFFKEARKGQQAFDELVRLGVRISKPNVYRECDGLAEMGFLTKEEGGYQAAPGVKIRVSEAN